MPARSAPSNRKPGGIHPRNAVDVAWPPLHADAITVPWYVVRHPATKRASLAVVR